MQVHPIPKQSRPKAPVIQPIQTGAPWVLLSKAATDSGLSERLIRAEGLPLRRFGNADYIRPVDLNAWILADGKEEPQP